MKKACLFLLISLVSVIILGQTNLVYLDIDKVHPDSVTIRGNNNNLLIGDDLSININYIPPEILKAIESKYQEKLNSLDWAYKNQDLSLYEKEEELERLKIEINVAIDQARVLKSKFETIDIEKSNQQYKKAYEAYFSGNTQLAIAALEAIDLDNEDRKNADNRKMRASLHAINFEFEKAEQNYEIAVRIYSDYENHYDFGDYLIGIHQYKKALVQVDQADKYADEPFKEYELSEMRVNAYMSYYDYVAAISEFENQVTIIARLDEDLSAFKLIAEALAYCTLGRIRKIVADNIFQSQMELLGKKDAKFYVEDEGMNPDAAKAFGRGVIMLDTARMDSIKSTISLYDESEAAYLKAIDLTDDAPLPVHRGNVKYVYSLLITFAQRNAFAHQYKEALGYYNRLNNVLDSLFVRIDIDINKTWIQAKKGSSLRNMAMVYNSLEQDEDALDAINESINIFEQLSQKDKEKFEENLAYSFRSYGIIQSSSLHEYIYNEKKNVYEEDSSFDKEYIKLTFQSVFKTQKKCTDLFFALYEKYPQKYFNDYATSILGIGFTAFQFGEFELARDYYKNGLAIFKQFKLENSLSSLATHVYEVILSDRACAREYRNIGRFYEAKGKFDVANRYYLKSLNYYNILIKKEPEDYFTRYREILDFCAYSYKRLSEFNLSKDYYNKWLNFELQNKNCHLETECLQTLTTIYGNLGEVYISLNDDEKATINFDTVIELYDRIVALDRNVDIRGKSVILINYASLLLSNNQGLSKSKEMLKEAESLITLGGEGGYDHVLSAIQKSKIYI